MVHRWQAPMASFGVRREAWRKGRCAGSSAAARRAG